MSADGFNIPGPHSLAYKEIMAWLGACEGPGAAPQHGALCPVRSLPMPCAWGSAAAAACQ